MRRALLTLLTALFAHVLGNGDPKLFILEMSEDEVVSARHVADHHGFRLIRRLHSFPNIFVAEQLPQRRKRSLEEIVAEIVTNRKINWAEPVTTFVREKRWLFSRNNSKSSLPKPMLTGKGVVVAILDDGVDYTHPSLAKSYSPEHSFNFVSDSSDPLPDDSLDNNHGTHCAGVVAMSPSSFGAGVAPDVSLAALKMLGSTESINDIVEGDALAYHHEKIDVYSVSWGPRDDGKALEAPRRLASMALERGVNQGRQGKGSLYVWASGNGGLEDDDCAMDGYASHKHTLTFGVIGSNGKPEWYAEGCPAVLASIPSDSASRWTTEVGGGFSKFSGSSAAAPFAAGILALLLQAKPELTQRDVQHLLVHSSQSEELVSLNPVEWQRNGAGLYVSRHFGFGALNRDKLLSMAASWKPVSAENTCIQELNNGSDIPFETTFKVNCKAITAVERVQLVVSLSHPRRGDVQIELVSPAGTATQMMRPRKNDNSSDGLTDWAFVSLHTWGENASGNWTVRVMDMGMTRGGGQLTKTTLLIHGTSR